jgi:hypothetical protein
VHLKAHLDKWYFSKDHSDILIEKLWSDMCNYLYMPRLARPQILTDTIARGIESRDYFGYADSKTAAAAHVLNENMEVTEPYMGFSFGERKTIGFDSDAVVISKETAENYIKYLEANQEKPTDESIAPKVPTGGTGPVETNKPTGEATSAPAKATRFFGVVSIDPIKAKLQFADIIDEVARHLGSDPHSTIEITVEITAQNAAGFDDATQRTVKENCGQLKFKSGEWEE